MIGVLANPDAHDVVREFFELFKTPWEWYRNDRSYQVVLAASAADLGRARAGLTVIYGAEPAPGAGVAKRTGARPGGTMLSYQGALIPLHGGHRTFPTDDLGLRDEASGRSAACVSRSPAGVVVRIGYDLFGEVRASLTVGQPEHHALIPTIDRHVALLRDVIVRWAPPLVEIPPAPEGYPFIVCLTHDVDHPSLRRHRGDHTMWGFLARATLGSLIKLLQGRAAARDVLANWTAALKLPLVHLGLARDVWAGFDRYVHADGGRPSTFFVIPFRHDAGWLDGGPAPRRRAAAYGAGDVAPQIRRLLAAGCEVGVHGIDAWRDSAKGRRELEEVAGLTGAVAIGIRMHWLYADGGSPARLERAGFTYDTTSGYNGAVGYRAGTTQIFKPLTAGRLLELPLHAMDTALFYPRHLHLSPDAARARVRCLVENARQHGGTVTLNWHDRSIAPERLWGGVYRQILDDVERERPWFATAGHAVAWFRKRRSVMFDAVGADGTLVRATLPVGADDHLPGLRLRIHTGRGAHEVSDLALSSGGCSVIPSGATLEAVASA